MSIVSIISTDVSADRTLIRFIDTKIPRDHSGPKKYEPGQDVYLEDDEWEADLRRPDKGRPGRMDMKQEVLERDGHQCRKCGCLVTSAMSYLDHIIPIHQFANFEQANTLDNVQTLCLYCHKQKTRSENSKFRIDWKAGCLETCTSGLGLESG